MSEALAALRAGAAALLDAERERALAAIVRAGEVAIVGPGEVWAMGAREVAAQRVVLAVDAASYAALTASAARVDAVKSAFARAMRSPDTELAELHVVMKLPVIERHWGSVYREAPVIDRPLPRPDPRAVLEGAAALLDALREPEAAAMVRRARLERAEVPGGELPLVRHVVRLAPPDFATVTRDPALGERVRQAVRDAATRADEAIAVELAVAIGTE